MNGAGSRVAGRGLGIRQALSGSPSRPIIAYPVPGGGLLHLTRCDDPDCSDTFEILSANAEVSDYAVIALALGAADVPVVAITGDGRPRAKWLTIGGGRFGG